VFGFADERVAPHPQGVFRHPAPQQSDRRGGCMPRYKKL